MKNNIVKILEAIDLLDYTFGRVLELHQSMINFLNDVSKTEKGKFIIEELNKILEQKKSQTEEQKDGLIKACGFTGGISVGVKLSDKILEKEDDMKEVARIIAIAINNSENEEVLAKLRADSLKLCEAHPLY